LGEIGSPLDRISVKQLTLEFSKDRRTPPSAPREWNQRMENIKQPSPNWEIVADRYTTRFLTPRDGATHFKHITHRALYTRNRNPSDTRNRKDKPCRLCHKAPESSTHLGQCPIIQSLFSRINRFGATPNRICSVLRQGTPQTQL
jgi:hypothetical protein